MIALILIPSYVCIGLLVARALMQWWPESGDIQTHEALGLSVLWPMLLLSGILWLLYTFIVSPIVDPSISRNRKLKRQQAKRQTEAKRLLALAVEFESSMKLVEEDSPAYEALKEMAREYRQQAQFLETGIQPFVIHPDGTEEKLRRREVNGQTYVPPPDGHNPETLRFRHQAEEFERMREREEAWAKLRAEIAPSIKFVAEGEEK